MTQGAIRDAFRKLRQRGDAAARCGRMPVESDWLVSINGTRAMTAFN
jgi:hypothetical protein